MKLLKVDSLEEARLKLIKTGFSDNIKKEIVTLSNSLGRILAEDIISPFSVPNFKRSTVDGYAVKSKDTTGATESIPTFLKIVGEVDMGEEANFVINSGECAYVPTGAMLPQGSDAMVMIEYCELFLKDSVAVYSSVAPNNNVVNIGDDILKNSIVLKKGRTIKAFEIGVLSAIGVKEVEVYKPIRVSIFSTGDELIDSKETLAFGKVYDINTPALQATCIEAGFEVVETAILPDKREILENAVFNAMKISDIVIMSGGSSQGEKDMTAEILDKATNGGLMTHGLALKPGKPTITAYDKETKKLLFGLPGHPVAAVMICRFLVIWLQEYYLGKSKERYVYANIATSLVGDQGKETVQLVRLEEKEEGYIAHPIFGKSGLITSLSKAEGYAIIGRNKEGIKEGEEIKIYLF